MELDGKINISKIKTATLRLWSIVAALAFIFLYYLKGTDTRDLILISILFLVFAGAWPTLYFKRVELFKKRAGEREFAEAIDYLRLYVTSGMGLEQAWRAMADLMRGVWGVEWRAVVRDIDRGIPFIEAIENMYERFQIADLRRFVVALRQAETLGASISDTLSIQADAIRTRRRQFAEERARTAAVKISVPLVLFIFPSLLIIYIGPAVLRLMQEV